MGPKVFCFAGVLVGCLCLTVSVQAQTGGFDPTGSGAARQYQEPDAAPAAPIAAGAAFERFVLRVRAFGGFAMRSSTGRSRASAGAVRDGMPAPRTMAVLRERAVR